MSEQIVVDIETLSTQTNAMIISVALVLVDTSQAIGSPQSIKAQAVFMPSLSDQIKIGRDVEKITNDWWDKQSEEARKIFYLCKRTPFAVCIQEIHDWLKKYDCPIWGNGSDFDNAILQNAFRSTGLSWSYWHNRCLRTLVKTTKELYPSMQLPDFKGVKHNALDDALHEARELTLCLSYLKGKG